MPEEIEVPTEELHEKMEEAAEEGGGGRKWISRVALSSALLAVIAAISALLAGHHESESLLDQMKASDKWGYFQAKSIKAEAVATRDSTLEALGKPVGDGPKTIERYKAEQETIQKEGETLEKSSEEHMAHHIQFAHAVTIFQIAIAIGAIAVLARRPKFWLGSLGLGIVGLVFFILGLV
jgi:hypothetical protein